MRKCVCLLSRSTKNSPESTKQLSEHISKHGVDCIWEAIKLPVAKRWFNNYGHYFFDDFTDPDFLGPINQVAKLIRFRVYPIQKDTAGSSNNQAYCSQEMRQNHPFFSSSLSQAQGSVDRAENADQLCPPGL